MSTSVCYLERSASGAALARVRLVGTRAQHAWAAPNLERAASDALASIGAAARWIAQESAAGPTRGELVMCLDPDGAHCGWVTSPSAEEAVVGAAVRAAQAGGADDAGTPPAPWLRDGDIGVDMSVQGLPEGLEGDQRRQRLAVLATPDLPVRVLLDELDSLGRLPARVLSIWHAMAESLVDDRTTGGRNASGVVVSSDEPVAAMVIVEPSGRLLWAWARAGSLLCCGSMRLRRTASAGSEPQVPEPAPTGAARRLTDDNPAPEVSVIEVSAQDVGRIVGEWLAWSAQLGVAPARVVCAGPTSLVCAGLGEDLPAVPGIAAAGHAIARAWDGATVEASVDDDPVGSVLRRLAEATLERGAAPATDARGLPVLDPRQTLVDLSRRPGKASRTYYHWAAAALLAGAVGIVALGLRLDRSAGALRTRAGEVKAERLALLDKVKDIIKIAPTEPDPVRKLRAEQTRLSTFAEKITPERPVLAEFGRVMRAAAAVPGATLKTLSIPTVGVGSGAFKVPDAEAGPTLLSELLKQPALGPRIMWTGNLTINGEERIYAIRGDWRDPEPAKPGTTGPVKSPATSPPVNPPAPPVSAPKDAPPQAKPPAPNTAPAPAPEKGGKP